jgi:hypothetical protein
MNTSFVENELILGRYKPTLVLHQKSGGDSDPPPSATSPAFTGEVVRAEDTDGSAVVIKSANVDMEVHLFSGERDRRDQH